MCWVQTIILLFSAQLKLVPTHYFSEVLILGKLMNSKEKSGFLIFLNPLQKCLIMMQVVKCIMIIYIIIFIH